MNQLNYVCRAGWCDVRSCVVRVYRRVRTVTVAHRWWVASHVGAWHVNGTASHRSDIGAVISLRDSVRAVVGIRTERYCGLRQAELAGQDKCDHNFFYWHLFVII